MPPVPATIRLANSSDISALVALMRDGFVHGFGHLYTGKNMADFLDIHFNPQAIAEALKAQGERGQGDEIIFVAEHEWRLLGYAQMGPCKLPIDVQQPPGLELYRLYTHPQAKGRGLGSQLMDACTKYALASPHKEWFVGVWSENHGAQRFYQRYGFKKAGEYKFMVGTHADHEFIMARAL
jgi:ribosomal protein S18 acetylase RimI-like enzyme